MVLPLSIILIAVISISCVNDNGYCDYKEEVSTKTDCQSVKNIDEGFVCCYVEYTDDDGKDVVKCHAVPKDDGYVDYAEALKDYEGFSVLCDSSNITFKTLGIMLYMFILL